MYTYTCMHAVYVIINIHSEIPITNVAASNHTTGDAPNCTKINEKKKH